MKGKNHKATVIITQKSNSNQNQVDLIFYVLVFRGGKFILRDETINGPMLDENGKYRPQKPTGWDESYPDGPPPWTDTKY